MSEGAPNGPLASAPVRVERIGRICRVTLDDPARRNALGTAMVAGLIAALRAADADPDVGAVLLTGSGQAFSAGADLKEFQGSLNETAPRHWESGDVWHELFSLVPAMAKPVIASVRGPAIAGGTGLVALCDLAVAAEGATFGTPEANIGLFPLFILPAVLRAIGPRHALDLALTGRTIDAAEAFRMGLVKQVVPSDDLDAVSLKLAEQVARKGSLTLRLGKHAFYRMAELDYPSGLDFARAIRGTFLASEELRAGVESFFHRSRPAEAGG